MKQDFQPGVEPDPFDDGRRVELKRKFPCSSCGGEAVWDPSKESLACPYCGTIADFVAPDATDRIQEHDLQAALRHLDNQEHGWDATKRTVRCDNCDAVTVFDPERVAQQCDFCGSPAIIPVDEQEAPIRPESLLPFRVAESGVRESIRKWYGTRWFAPNRLSKVALTDTLRGLYVPYWTFDARVQAEWSALAGYYHYSRNAEGQTVRTIHWEPAAGQIAHFFDDELVSASKGMDGKLLRGIEPFPTTSDLRPYSAGFVSGWVVEQYQVDLSVAAEFSLQSMHQQIHHMCDRAVPGDTHQNLQVNAQFSDQTFKHTLVPVWLLSYTYGRKLFHVAVNGYTGRISGVHPLSWIKITLAVFAALAIVYMLFQTNQR